MPEQDYSKSVNRISQIVEVPPSWVDKKTGAVTVNIVNLYFAPEPNNHSHEVPIYKIKDIPLPFLYFLSISCILVGSFSILFLLSLCGIMKLLHPCFWFIGLFGACGWLGTAIIDIKEWRKKYGKT